MNPLKYRRKSDGKVVWGCVKTSPGCAHCYSEALALRWDRGRLFNARNMEEMEPFLDEAELQQMLTAKKVSGSKVFVGDMTDVAGEWVSDDLLDHLFAVMALRGDATFQVLTKRADRLATYFATGKPWQRISFWMFDHNKYSRLAAEVGGRKTWPLPNVWLGVSAENQQYADERIPRLLATPAAVRFVSYEPALGPLTLHKYLAECECGHGHGFTACPNTGGVARVCHVPECPCHGLRPRLHWLIAGGESGPGHRPCEIEWFASLARQCAAAGVAFHMKQDSGPRPGTQGRIPDALWRLKEFPR